jgi:CheY-like chemotaxis protein
VKGRILIVCPQRAERIRLERVLRQEGYEVVFAESAERALQRTSQELFDLLIAEEQLPGLGGLELVRALAAQPARPVAILLCDSPTAEAERLAAELGAQAYLARPFRILDLLSACQSGVRAAQLRSKRRLVH